METEETKAIILDNGNDICFYCARVEGRTTLAACEELCRRYNRCDTAAWADDELREFEIKG